MYQIIEHAEQDRGGEQDEEGGDAGQRPGGAFLVHGERLLSRVCRAAMRGAVRDQMISRTIQAVSFKGAAGVTLTMAATTDGAAAGHGAGSAQPRRRPEVERRFGPQDSAAAPPRAPRRTRPAGPSGPPALRPATDPLPFGGARRPSAPPGDERWLDSTAIPG